MKLSCLHCMNENQDKFSATKTGFICLICFEKKITKSPENEAERAQLNIESPLTRTTGSNNRGFTKAYRAMKNYEKFLELLPEKTEQQNFFLQGVSKAIHLFEDSSRN